MRFYDAHSHLQDPRLREGRLNALQDLQARGVAAVVVNGTCEADWPAVLELAREHSFIIPAIGLHPWFVKERSPGWLDALRRGLDSNPRCAVGEIGLDKWIEGYDLGQQEEVFRAQLEIAAGRNLPVAIHCLKAWGMLEKILGESKRPEGGFLLHSYGGPREMIAPLAKLGAYFSVSGYFALPKKRRQFESFREVPADRLLIETDAPDMCLPEEKDEFHLQDANGDRINHPGNIVVLHGLVAELFGISREELAARTERNFLRLFRA